MRTQADLHRHWRAMMGELGFGQRQSWFQFFDADSRCTPVGRASSHPTGPGATGLAKAAADAGARSHPVHLANDHELRVFATDDEIASA